MSIRLSVLFLGISLIVTGAMPLHAQISNVTPGNTGARAAAPGGGYESALHSLAATLIGKLEDAGQKSGTVLDFTDLQGQGTELGRFLAQELSDQLVTTAGKFSLIDRANLQYLLNEKKLSASGLINPESSRKLGNMIGIDTVILGTVTPIGQNVRLSVRAVAVETGKIVVSQSATLPAIGGLGDMYTRGVADNTGAPQLGDSGAASKPNVRDRLRADSFKLIPGELVASTNFDGSQISFSVENRSGIGVGIALRAQATSAGPCRVMDNMNVKGLSWISGEQIKEVSESPDPVSRLRWFPPNARVIASIDLDTYQCPKMVQGVASVPLTVNLVVAYGKDVLVVPLTVDKVPVRVVR
jgi:TolB-like protein